MRAPVRRNSARILTVVAATCALATAAAVPAWAGDWRVAAANRLTVWSSDLYEGTVYIQDDKDPNLHDNEMGDRASSVVNRTGYYWKLYEDKDYKGKNFCIRPRSRDGNIGDNTTLEDDISSVKRQSDDSGCDSVIGTAN